MENYVKIQNLINAFDNGEAVPEELAVQYLKEALKAYEQKSMTLQDYEVELEETKIDVEKMRKDFTKIYNLLCDRLDSGRYETLDIQITDICLEQKN